MLSSSVIYGLGCCSNGRLILSPIDLPPARHAPLLAASIIPGPPPEQTTKRLSSRFFKDHSVNILDNLTVSSKYLDISTSTSASSISTEVAFSFDLTAFKRF